MNAYHRYRSMKLNDPGHSSGASIYDLQKTAEFPVYANVGTGRTGADQIAGIE